MGFPAFSLEQTLSAFNQLQLSGNVIPHTWYQRITFENGKPDVIAILILAEIVYWYRPVVEKDQRTGNVIGLRQKFKGEMLDRPIGSYAKQFGISEYQASSALKRLSDQGLIVKIVKTIDTPHGRIGNKLFIAPIAQKIADLQLDIPVLEPLPIDELDSYTIVAEPNNQASTVEIESHQSIYQGEVPPLPNQLGKVPQLTRVGTPIDCASIRKEIKEEIKEKQQQQEEKPKKITTCESGTFAAAVSLSSQDSLIDKHLTLNQQRVVAGISADLLTYLPATYTSAQLSAEITFALEHPDYFTQAGADFLKKLNTIKKMIRTRQWVTPAGQQQTQLDGRQAQARDMEKRIQKLTMQLQECAGAISHDKQTIEFLKESGKAQHITVYQNSIVENEEKYQCLQGELARLTQENPGDAL